MSLVYQSDVFVGKRRPGLYLGGKTDAKDAEKLDRWNVSHILNVTPSKEACIQAGVPNYFESRYKYKRIPIYDASTSASDFVDKADEIVRFIATGLCHGSVLVHCQRGVSRSTTAVLLYLMRRVGMPLKDAMDLVKRRRPQAEPIPAFVEMLERYEDTCRSLGVIHSSGDRPSKRKMGAALPSQDATTKRKRTIGPQVGPSVPEKPAKDREAKLQPIGPSLGPLHQEDSKQSVGPAHSAIGPERPSSKPRKGGDSLKLKAKVDDNRKVDGPKAAEDRSE